MWFEPSNVCILTSSWVLVSWDYNQLLGAYLITISKALWLWTLKSWDQLVWEFIIPLIPQSQKFRQTKSNSNFKYVHINIILHFALY